jgi:ABC-type bacteriocin/lantibiotic exporter with double-glycine peptidase domain
MPPHEQEKKKVRIWPVLRDYFAAAWKYPIILGSIVLGTLLIEGSSVIAPLFMKQFVDVISTATRTEAVVRTLLLILGGFFLFDLVGWFGRRVQMISIMRIEARAMSDLSNKGFAHLLGHAHDFFISNFTGTLTRRVTRYARSFEQVLDSFMLNFLPTVLFAIGVIAVLFMRNAVLGIGLLI